MDIVLVAGLWLRASAWDTTADALRDLGHRPLPVELPGVDDGATTATLDDQVSAVSAAIEGAERPLVVGHSAACTLVWLAADRHPESVHQLAFIGGFPASDGEVYADFFPMVDGAMPFPGWEPFEGADAADLDEEARQHLAERAVPVPEGVAKGHVRLSDDRRYAVPVLAICPEYTPDQARAWIDGGDVPELANAQRVSFVDIDSGHWPMVTKPTELASILDTASRELPQ